MRPSPWLLVPIVGLLALAVGYAIGGAVSGGGDDDAPSPTGVADRPAPPPAAPADALPADAPDDPTATPTPPEPTADPAVEYAFPVQPPAAATYGRDHHDYPATDVFAECGTTVVAPVGGVVDEVTRTDVWNERIDDPATRGGLSVSIVGVDGVRHYASHLQSVEPGIVAGSGVRAGQPIGRVGRSGNAADTPCHVHYGLSPPRGPGDWEVRRGTVHPWPYLDAWIDGHTTVSPADAVAAWATANP